MTGRSSSLRAGATPNKTADTHCLRADGGAIDIIGLTISRSARTTTDRALAGPKLASRKCASKQSNRPCGTRTSADNSDRTRSLMLPSGSMRNVSETGPLSRRPARSAKT